MIGKNIKRIRLEKEMTLEQLAEKLGKSYPHIQAIESGRSQPKDETILHILVDGFDYRPSEAKNLMAEWRIEDVLEKAPDPKQVINNIKMGKNSKYYNFEGENISIGDIN